MKNGTLTPHSRMAHAQDSGPGVGARCLLLVEKIAKRYGPKVSRIKEVALTFEEQQRLLASGVMQKPDLSEMEAIHARAMRYRYGRKSIPEGGRRPIGKPPLADVVETTKEAVAHVARYGKQHGYLKRLAKLRGVNYYTLASSYYTAINDRKHTRHAG